jgi:sirohydrochlorin ferrochelatase
MKRAILLVDHGSRRAEANAQLERIAERVRQRVPDRLVEVAHMELAEPTVGGAIDACAAEGADEIVVHPFFLGPGRHTTDDIPELVAEAAARHPDLRVRVSAPLGEHPALVDAILARVGEVES